VGGGNRVLALRSPGIGQSFQQQIVFAQQVQHIARAGRTSAHLGKNPDRSPAERLLIGGQHLL
jgi:hypothetical protein